MRSDRTTHNNLQKDFSISLDKKKKQKKSARCRINLLQILAYRSKLCATRFKRKTAKSRFWNL